MSGQHLEGNTEAKQSFRTCFRTNKALNKWLLLAKENPGCARTGRDLRKHTHRRPGAGQKQLSRTRNQHGGLSGAACGWCLNKSCRAQRPQPRTDSGLSFSSCWRGHGKGVALGPGTCDVCGRSIAIPKRQKTRGKYCRGAAVSSKALMLVQPDPAVLQPVLPVLLLPMQHT